MCVGAGTLLSVNRRIVLKAPEREGEDPEARTAEFWGKHASKERVHTYQFTCACVDKFIVRNGVSTRQCVDRCARVVHAK